jgi:hypothetical protein
MSGIILIGSSDCQIKTIDIDINFENNIYIIDKNNWINDHNYNDTFKIIINNGKCICKRIDINCGWDMELIINANIIIDYSKLATIPVFFINLEKDKERLIFIQNILYKIFDNNNIYRIEGVKHNIGLEGCRLAHINAHISAINKGYNYYIIAEDDIQPLVDINSITNYVLNTILFNPDLVLLEQGQHLEERIKLSKISENMYRIYGGGNNTGCYLCSRNFGIKLIKHWIKHSMWHIDGSWQELWKSNNVYFHRPQLFHQREGISNQNDVNYREITLPFNWELYEKLNQ